MLGKLNYSSSQLCDVKNSHLGGLAYAYLSGPALALGVCNNGLMQRAPFEKGVSQ